MSSRPNVLFIVSDQHNAKVLGHQAHPDVQTPNLDRMASEGVRFDTCITQNPICTPSRVSFLSGQYCHNHGYYGLSGPNPRGLPTVLGHFRRFGGYTTAAIGKIHCPEYWVEDDADVFHETCGVSVGGQSPTYRAFLTKRGKYEQEDHGVMNDFGKRGRQSMEGRPSKLTFDECQEGWIANTAIEVMKQASADGKPFFIHASLPRPHQCTAPCQEFWDLYETEKLTLPPNADYDLAAARKAPHLIRQAEHWRTGNWALIEPKTFEAARMRKMHGYLGAISQVDAAVGRMLDHLREAGLAENTIVVYTADHGDYAAEHGIMEKAPGICHDAITRVPFIWWGPERFPAGHVTKQIAELVDVSNTLCAQAGLPLMETADGRDLSGLLAGGDEPVHRVGVTEFAQSKSVRKGKYRLVHYPPDRFADEYPHDQFPDGFGELYDLEADPYEMKNLFFDADYADVVRDLRGELLNWLIATTRPVTTLGGTNGPVAYDNPQQHHRYQHSVNADGKSHPDRAHEAAANYL